MKKTLILLFGLFSVQFLHATAEIAVTRQGVINVNVFTGSNPISGADEGSYIMHVDTFNCAGAGITCTDAGNGIMTLTVPGGAGFSGADFIQHTTTADILDTVHNSTLTRISIATDAIKSFMLTNQSTVSALFNTDISTIMEIRKDTSAIISAVALSTNPLDQKNINGPVSIYINGVPVGNATTINLTTNLTGSSMSGSTLTAVATGGGPGGGMTLPLPNSDTGYFQVDSSPTVTGSPTFTSSITVTNASMTITNGSLQIGTTLTVLTTGYFYGAGAIGPAPNVLSNEVLALDGNVNSYLQLALQNRSNGTQASGDLVITNDAGTDALGYIDLGINSSGNQDRTYQVIPYGFGYLYTASSGLVIGAMGSGLESQIRFVTGGSSTPFIRLFISSGGLFGMGTTTPTAQLDIMGSSLSVKNSIEALFGVKTASMLVSGIDFATWVGTSDARGNIFVNFRATQDVALSVIRSTFIAFEAYASTNDAQQNKFVNFWSTANVSLSPDNFGAHLATQAANFKSIAFSSGVATSSVAVFGVITTTSGIIAFSSTQTFAYVDKFLAVGTNTFINSGSVVSITSMACPSNSLLTITTGTTGNGGGDIFRLNPSSLTLPSGSTVYMGALVTNSTGNSTLNQGILINTTNDAKKTGNFGIFSGRAPGGAGTSQEYSMFVNSDSGTVSVGTNTSYATLTVWNQNGQKYDFWVGSGTTKTSLTQPTSDYALAITSNSAISFSTSTGKLPTLSGCGSSPTVRGSRYSFTITPGATASGCTATFSIPFLNNPHCSVTPQTGSVTNTLSYAYSNVSVVVTETALSSQLDVDCHAEGE